MTSFMDVPLFSICFLRCIEQTIFCLKNQAFVTCLDVSQNIGKHKKITENLDKEEKQK